MASLSKKRSLSKIELETIDYQLEQRKRPRLQPSGRPLPSATWKPLFLNLVQENLGISPADAEQTWNGLIDRITTYIQDNGLAGIKRRKPRDCEFIKSQLTTFAQMPENKQILDVFDEPIRSRVLASLEVNSRQRIRDGMKRAKAAELKATEAPPLPLLNDKDGKSPSPSAPSILRPWECNVQLDAVTFRPLVCTFNKDRSQGIIIDIDRFRIDCDLPIAEDNLDFEQYLTYLERTTDFKRHKDSLSWILPLSYCHGPRSRARIIDGTDWSNAITLPLRLEGKSLEFEFSAADETSNMGVMPLAVTMGRAKRQSSRIQKAI